MKTVGFGKWFWLALVMVLTLALQFGVVQAAPMDSFGERFERSLGRGTAPEIVKEYGGEYVLPIKERLWVEEIFRRLIAVTDRQNLEYTLTVLNSSDLNAFALPGGYVLVTKGLVNAIGDDEAKLSAVLAHEIAHIEKKHGVNGVLRQMGLTVLFEVGAIAL
ncbi:MAG TPA: hypothetical protein DDW87_12310, partial [Firmicutes bacterium]|nr:hypothetical protein [Bacillota bacterium]